MIHTCVSGRKGCIMNKNKHLTQELRYKIQHGLSNGLSFKAIGAEIGKDCTTVSKEVKAHRLFEKTGAPGRVFNDCSHRFSCSQNLACPSCHKSSKAKCSACGRCMNHCPLYTKEHCRKLGKPPYVCNGCKDRSRCTLEKSFYKALDAQREYELIRSESRSGLNISEEELVELNRLISPLILNGQSIHHICASNPGLINCCEKTLYHYADAGLLTAKNIDMPRKVRFRVRKKKSVSLKVDKACRVGRTYEDFQVFMKDHPNLPVTELDTVEGVKGGACLLTVHAVLPKLQLAFKRMSNNAASVTDAINWVYDRIGRETFCKIFPVLLCDNGTEFSDPKSLEFDKEGLRRCHVFYCDPYSSHQKGSCENNHEFIRRVIPKGVDISFISLGHIDLMMSHINSYGRPDLGDRSPYEVFSFLYGEDILPKLRITKVERNKVVLRPSLLKRKL